MIRPLALTWVMQKNGLASSKGDAQRAIISEEVLVDGVHEKDPARRLCEGRYLIQRNGWGEVRARIGT